MAFRNLSSPVARLKSTLTNAIGTAIKRTGGLKTKNMLVNLPYAMEDLQDHLEKQFEPWMNWDNWGLYCQDHKTWQIDHIVPQSSLPFTDVNDDNFLKCWDLSNLRPLESTNNLQKGKRSK